MSPNPMEDIARRLANYEKRLSHLERLESPNADVKSEFLEPGAFAVTFGAVARGVLPSTQSGLNFDTWRFDDSVEEVVTGNWRIPPGITTPITYNIYWAMDTATVGAVRVVMALAAVADGELLTGGSEETDIHVVAVPGVARTLEITTGTFTSPIAGGDLMGVIINRQGGVMGDTASGDLHFLGIEFTW